MAEKEGERQKDSVCGAGVLKVGGGASCNHFMTSIEEEETWFMTHCM